MRRRSKHRELSAIAATAALACSAASTSAGAVTTLSAPANSPAVDAAWATLNGLALGDAPQEQPPQQPLVAAPAPDQHAASSAPAAQSAAGTAPASAGSAPAAPTPRQDENWPSAVQPSDSPKTSVGAGYLHQFSAGIDQGANVSVDRFYASFSSRLFETQEFNLVLSMGYEFDWYHWNGTSSLGTNDPFGSVNLFALQLRGSYQINHDWSVMVGGIFGIAGETNADVGSSLYGGGLVSVNWTPSKDFILGLGVLALTQIEDQPLVIPVPILHIRLSDEWVLSTMRRPPASPFVGIDVAWEPENSKVDFAIGIGWQQRRFRLGENANALLNDGVGEDQSWAALASVGYDLLPTLRLDLLGGFTFYEKLQLETSNGRTPRDATVSPNALLGAFVTYRF